MEAPVYRKRSSDSPIASCRPSENPVACRTMKLSVVMPVYNEERTVSKIVDIMLSHPLVDELIIVDDASKDGTRSVLENYRSHQKVQLYFQEKNQGKGAALRTGFQYVTGDYMIVQDADLEYDPSQYSELLAPLLKGEADVVYGSRFMSGDRWKESFVHTAGNRALSLISNITTGFHLTDMETCYKVIPTRLLRKMRLRSNRFGIEPEITAKLAALGARIREVPVRYEPRSYEEGKKIKFMDAVQAVWVMLRSRLES